MQEMAFEKLSKKQLTSSRCSKRSGTMSVQTKTEETAEGCTEAKSRERLKIPCLTQYRKSGKPKGYRTRIKSP